MQRRRRFPGTDVKEQLRQMRAANEALHIANKALKMELFESWKAAGEFNKAGQYYEDLLEHDCVENAAEETAAMILNLKQSYVDMLIKQGGRFEEAVGLAEEVWVKREAADPLTDLSKESHRHLCSIYTALKRPAEAERMHKLAYERYKGRQDPAWALENGDECCKQLAEQQKYEEAAVMQADVWSEREKAANGRRTDPNTIKSGKSRILLLERFSVSLADQAESESQKNWRRSKREACEHEIDLALRRIWDTAGSLETESEILDLGHKLGARLLAGKRFSEAEVVLNQVWQRRKLATNGTDPQAMSAGRLLATAVKLQGSTEYQRAVTIYRRILDNYKTVFGQENDETIAVGKDLAATLYHLGQYSGDSGAEEIYGWVLEQVDLKSQQNTSAAIAARFDLGQAMYRQGDAKYDKATGLLQTVYDHWYKTLPHPAGTRECGHMLVEMYKQQKAVEPLKALFDGRKRLETKDLLYMESGYAYGRILVEQDNHELARETMRPLWEYDRAVKREKEFRVRCGRLYGQILLRLKEYNLAQVILLAVLRAQSGVFETGTPEFTKVSALLVEAQQAIEAQRAISARTILKPRDKNIRAGAKPKRHSNGN